MRALTGRGWGAAQLTELSPPAAPGPAAFDFPVGPLVRSRSLLHPTGPMATRAAHAFAGACKCGAVLSSRRQQPRRLSLRIPLSHLWVAAAPRPLPAAAGCRHLLHRAADLRDWRGVRSRLPVFHHRGRRIDPLGALLVARRRDQRPPRKVPRRPLLPPPALYRMIRALDCAGAVCAMWAARQLQHRCQPAVPPRHGDRCCHCPRAAARTFPAAARAAAAGAVRCMHRSSASQ